MLLIHGWLQNQAKGNMYLTLITIPSAIFLGCHIVASHIRTVILQNYIRLGLGVAVFFCLFLFKGNIAHALTPPTQYLQANNAKNSVLVVGSEQEFPPFSTGMTDSEAGGFTVELWKAVAAEVGLAYTVRVMPFHQLLQAFKDGQVDVMINLAQSDKRKEFADFTVPHVVVHGAIFVRKGTNNIRSERDLDGKSIIVLNADLAHDYAVSKGWQKQLVLVDTIQKGLKLLASGKHDAMLLSKLAGLQSLQATGLTNIEVLKVKVGFSQKFSFAVQKGYSDLLSQLNEGLALTKSNGTYNLIYEKWFGVYEEHERGLKELLIYFAPPIVLLLALSTYFYYSRKLERKQALEEMRTAAIAFETQEGIMVMDVNSVILRVNRAFTKITGFTPEEAIGQTLSLLNSGRHNEGFYRNMWESIHLNGFWQGEVWNRRKNGEIYPENLTITAVKGAKGEILNFVGIFTDITENKKQEEQRLINESKYRSALVREVHHRIKNNLQGVLLIMDNLATKYPELKEMMDSVKAKVNSIAIVHGIQGININSQIIVVELINAIVDNNQSLFNCRIPMHVQDDLSTIFLAETEAVPTALMLNELLINAIKHSDDLTRVSVHLHYDISKQKMIIEIKNVGRLSKDGTIDRPEFGTGLQLVKSLMPQKHLELFWKQDHDCVITIITLSPPIITKEPEPAT